MMVLMLTVNRHVFTQIKRNEISSLDFEDNTYWRKIITGKKFTSVRVTKASQDDRFIDFKFAGYKRWHTTTLSKNQKLQTYLRVFLYEVLK